MKPCVSCEGHRGTPDVMDEDSWVECPDCGGTGDYDKSYSAMAKEEKL